MIVPSTQTSTVTLHVEGIDAGYAGHKVLNSFTPQPLRGGELIGLLGPNASGKSTFIKTLAGVLRPHSGRVWADIDGQRVGGKQLRSAVGYVPQDLPTSAALTAFETVLIAARRATHAGAATAADMAAATMEELGLAPLAQSYLGELSGGQRQLVAVAQMLVTHPRIMLLDEPTSALDLHRQLFLLEQVRNRARQTGAVALVAIHDINLAARFCGELLVMRGGEVLRQGAPADILSPELIDQVYSVYARILDDQGVPLISPVVPTN